MTSEAVVPDPAPLVEKGHPKGLYVLFGTEMWERFGYYGMRALLGLYMISALGFTQARKSIWYGWYTGLVYMTPILGGYIADKILGFRKTIILGATMMMSGYFLLMVPDMRTFVAALALLILGNGMFKPNISTLVGRLYKRGDPRRDAGFSIFYMGINLGATFSPLVCGTLGEHYDAANHPIVTAFKWGFAAAGVGMLLGLVNFIVGLTRLSAVNMEVAIHETAAATAAGKPPTMQSEAERKQEWGRIVALLIIAFFTIFFWMGYEQAGNTLTDFAKDNIVRDVTLPIVGKYVIPVTWFQFPNAFFIIVLAPLFSVMWVWMGRRGIEPPTTLKMVLGLAFVGVGYIVMTFAALAGGNTGRVSMWWLIGMYFIHTVGELCLSPIGLSLVTKLAPARLGGMLMGVWFLAVFAGNKLAGNIGELYSKYSHVTFFEILIGTSIIPAVVLLLLLRPLKKLMAGAVD